MQGVPAVAFSIDSHTARQQEDYKDAAPIAVAIIKVGLGRTVVEFGVQVLQHDADLGNDGDSMTFLTLISTSMLLSQCHALVLHMGVRAWLSWLNVSASMRPACTTLQVCLQVQVQLA